METIKEEEKRKIQETFNNMFPEFKLCGVKLKFPVIINIETATKAEFSWNTVKHLIDNNIKPILN